MSIFALYVSLPHFLHHAFFFTNILLIFLSKSLSLHLPLSFLRFSFLFKIQKNQSKFKDWKSSKRVRINKGFINRRKHRIWNFLIKNPKYILLKKLFAGHSKSTHLKTKFVELKCLAKRPSASGLNCFETNSLEFHISQFLFVHKLEKNINTNTKFGRHLKVCSGGNQHINLTGAQN